MLASGAPASAIRNGTAAISLLTTAGEQVRIANVASPVNYLQLVGAATTGAVAISAQGSDAAVALALVPKGTGALVAAVPDSGVTGGNARGTNAVDLQTNRTAATQVASGANSHIGGGLSNTASGAAAVAAGGQSSVASGANSVVVGGFTCSATAANATVGGGNVNIADADSACVPGGRRGTARGTYGKFAFASGMFTSTGDAQLGEHVLRRQTTDATPVLLTADGGAPTGVNQLAMPNNSAYAVRYSLVAKTVAGSDIGYWAGDFLAYRLGSAATVIAYGPPSAVGPALYNGTGTNWRLSCTLDTTNGLVSFQVTGEISKTINWVLRLSTSEIVG